MLENLVFSLLNPPKLNPAGNPKNGEGFTWHKLSLKKMELASNNISPFFTSSATIFWFTKIASLIFALADLLIGLFLSK